MTEENDDTCSPLRSDQVQQIKQKLSSNVTAAQQQLPQQQLPGQQRTRRTSNVQRPQTTSHSNRKLSVPTLLYGHGAGRLGNLPSPPDCDAAASSVTSRQRRFSNVMGDNAVARKLSTTMGWRAVVSVQEIVTQAISWAPGFILETCVAPSRQAGVRCHKIIYMKYYMKSVRRWFIK